MQNTLETYEKKLEEYNSEKSLGIPKDIILDKMTLEYIRTELTLDEQFNSENCSSSILWLNFVNFLDNLIDEINKDAYRIERRTENKCEI